MICHEVLCMAFENLTLTILALRFNLPAHPVDEETIGSFSNDDGDGIEDVKKAIGLLRKTTTLHVHHAFLYISLPSLHDYDAKQATT